MIADRQGFALRLRRLAHYHGRDLDDATLRRWWDLLHNRITDEQFARACGQLESGQWFPTPARILAAVDRGVDVLADAQITSLYERVRACQAYGPTVGSYYSLRMVEQELGPVAAMLFQAAGGAEAFGRALRDELAEPWVRKAFAEAARALRADPDALAAITAHGTALVGLPGPLRQQVALIGSPRRDQPSEDVTAQPGGPP